MNNFKRALLLIVASVIFFWMLVTVCPAGECFSIIVGKEASANGYVMLGHNEDNGPPVAVNHHKVPRKKYKSGDITKLVNGGELPQIEETWAYIWSEIPGEAFSDAFVNEWGVAIASDKCLSREDKPELTDGGISLMFRRIIAQRAKTAREGIKVAAELVERFGYDSSGRSYMICDPDEGWMFCAINGKHWLAERVPDDEVAVIGNSYTVRIVNPADTNHFMMSPDLIDYAQSRGWYDPEADSVFDFAAVFADSIPKNSSFNLCRQWGGFRFLSAESPRLGYDLPFSIKPDHKITVTDIIKILRDHYEDTKVQELQDSATTPHQNKFHTICNDYTYNSFVVELRRNMPLDIGIVYWFCLGNPCSSFYLPFHFGIGDFPVELFTSSEKPTEAVFNEMIAQESPAPKEAFWRYLRFANKIQSDYFKYKEPLDSIRGDFEVELMTAKDTVEKQAMELYESDKIKAKSQLGKFFMKQYIKTFMAMDSILTADNK